MLQISAGQTFAKLSLSERLSRLRISLERILRTRILPIVTFMVYPLGG